MIECFGKFEDKEICLSGCKYADDCAKKSDIKIDRKLQAKLHYKKGRISFKEMVECSWNLSGKKSTQERIFIPDVKIKEAPQVDQDIQDRMDWINN